MKNAELLRNLSIASTTSEMIKINAPPLLRMQRMDCAHQATLQSLPMPSKSIAVEYSATGMRILSSDGSNNR
ncbi:hypothetical protein QW180_29110 [Vibrio sinaloensis]|nr:hypothetical protein [Vibrio sinaloensis]